MRIALVSPLPPAPSGVAEYAERIAAGLRGWARVDAFEVAPADRLAEYEVRLYQIGNNVLHAGAYDAALATPGVVELHDAVLHHFLLGRLDREQYIEEHVYNGGEWMRGPAAELWERRSHASTSEEFFRHPLLKRVVDAAAKVIVHNPGAERLVRQARPGADIVEIPHYVDPAAPASEEAIARVRGELSVDEKEMLVSCFGYHRPTKRLRSVLEAAARVRAPVKLLICGSFVSRDYEASLGARLDSPEVIRLPYVDSGRFAELAAATDVCVNLRWPSAGETSGIAMKLMAAGKPVVVTGSPENAGFPDSTVVRIDAGEAEVDMLAEVLELLARNADLHKSIGREARSFVTERHDSERVMRLYREALG